MDYTFYLPDEKGRKLGCDTDINSVIIIGANGAGKSKLGAWIEQDNFQNTHRIGAQRSLAFGNYIKQMSYEQATHQLITGTDHPTNDHDQRWKWDGEKYNYTASLLDDYEAVLSAVWAKQVKEESEYVQKCKEKDAASEPHTPVPKMTVDILYHIWSSVFPHRAIRLDDGKVIASFYTDDRIIEYKARDMSDGERVALYLICQALCVPPNKTIIVDEPELHLHRSIMNRLWNAIEKARQDCLFIFITHDTQFAASHGRSIKVWVKSYDGHKWEYAFVQDAELPSQLMLDIMGNRRKVLFVEGTNDSYDTLLYSNLFSEYYVVACGSCSKVIEQTKAMRANNQLHNLACYGLIDRDYRSELEISALNAKGIYALSVAEVENLFIVEELLDVVSQLQGYKDRTGVNLAKSYIMEKRFQPELQKQIRSAAIAEIKYQISVLDISGSDDTDIQNTIANFFSGINFGKIKQPFEERYTSAYDSRDYKSVVKIFNRKSLKDSIGHFFGITDKDYCDYVVRQLNGNNANLIKDALRPYLPNEIPI